MGMMMLRYNTAWMEVCTIFRDLVPNPRPKGIVCAIYCLLMTVLLMQAQKMQMSMDKFSYKCIAFSLTISTKKMEVLYQPAPNKAHSDPTITVNGQFLRSVNKFTYLGSTLSRDVRIDDEVALRLSKASSAFGRLQTNMWNRKGLSIDTKLKVYWAVVLPL